MTQKTVEVIIDKDGNANIEVSGFSDGQCLKETEKLEQALGAVSGRSRKNYTAGGVATGVPLKTGQK